MAGGEEARAGRAEGGGEKYKRMWCRGTPALKDLGGSCRGTLWQAPDSFPPPPPSRGNIPGGVAWLRLFALPTWKRTSLAQIGRLCWVWHWQSCGKPSASFTHAFSLTGLGWMVTVTVWMDIYGCIVKIVLHSGSLNQQEIFFSIEFSYWIEPWRLFLVLHLLVKIFDTLDWISFSFFFYPFFISRLMIKQIYIAPTCLFTAIFFSIFFLYGKVGSSSKRKAASTWPAQMGTPSILM